MPQQRVGAQRIVLIRAHKPRNKILSCIGQAVPKFYYSSEPMAVVPSDRPAGSALHGVPLQHHIYLCIYIKKHIYVSIFKKIASHLYVLRRNPKRDIEKC